MQATVFEIAERTQTFPGEVRHTGQFQLVNPSKTNAEIVLEAGWSLYCLDIAGNTALFVELPAGTNLSAAPFYYAAQFDHARRAAVVPFDALPELAAMVAEPAILALLMSTGRCGSTLASRIFAQIPGVWSLSEPDWFTNLAFGRFELSDVQRDTLIAACTRLTCRIPDGVSANSVVIKPRSELLIQAAAYVDVLDNAGAVFLYRDVYGYANSLYRFAQRLMGEKDPAPGSMNWEIGRQLSTINAPHSLLRDYFDERENVEMADLITLGWTLRMRAYLKSKDGGMQVTPIHYNDLNADRSEQTRLLLESCGIDAAHLESALHGFDQDAHKGTGGENAVPAEPLSDSQRKRVGDLVERWGISDYVTDRLPAL